jgi:hypothetical protein
LDFKGGSSANKNAAHVRCAESEQKAHSTAASPFEEQHVFTVNQRERLESQIRLQIEVSFLLGCGAASLGHLCPTFRYHIVVAFARIERFINKWTSAMEEAPYSRIMEKTAPM